MKHAIILAHPSERSFNAAIAKTYVEAVRRRGHEPILRDLYRINFDPCLQDEEIPRPGGHAPGADVVAERAILAEADVFVFVYPLWFNAPPAMIKGYVDRVFSMDFGYGPIEGAGNVPLLVGRRMLSFTTSGSPIAWLRESGAWTALRTLFDGHLAQVCGLTPVDHIHFGDTTPELSPIAAANRLKQVAEAATRIT